MQQYQVTRLELRMCLCVLSKAVQPDFFSQNVCVCVCGGVEEGCVKFMHLKVTQQIPGCSQFLGRCKKAKRRCCKGFVPAAGDRNATAVLLRVQEAEKSRFMTERTDGIHFQETEGTSARANFRLFPTAAVTTWCTSVTHTLTHTRYKLCEQTWISTFSSRK